MKGCWASRLIAACYIGRVALALDANLAQEAVSKLQQYIQLRTSSRSAAPEALTSDELDAAARMYALEVCDSVIITESACESSPERICSALPTKYFQAFAWRASCIWRLHASQTPWDQL